MNIRRILMVAAMHARGLARRRLALVILTAVPTAFYLSAELAPVDPETERLLAADPTQALAAELWIVDSAVIGVSWVIAVAALFVIIGSRPADQPLLLAGFRGIELLAGRVVTVLAMSALLTPLFSVMVWSQREIDLGLLTVAMGLAGLVAVATGVLATAFVPREMEGVLVILGVVGVQMTATVQNWMPLWGTSQLIRRASGLDDVASVATATLHASAFTAAMLVVGGALWARRTRLRQPIDLLATGAGLPVWNVAVASPRDGHAMRHEGYSESRG